MTNRKTTISNKKQSKAGGDMRRSTNFRPDMRLHRILPVRLANDKLELIRKEADELGIGPSTLARIWIMDSLRKVAIDNHSDNGGSPE